MPVEIFPGIFLIAQSAEDIVIGIGSSREITVADFIPVEWCRYGRTPPCRRE